MSSPDQHTSYILDEVGDAVLALRFHLTSRVWPYWSNENVDRHAETLFRAIGAVTMGDGHLLFETPSGPLSAERIVDGLNLWSFVDADDGAGVYEFPAPEGDEGA